MLLGGDYTARDKSDEWIKFGLWLSRQEYKKKVLIAGNHDKMVESCPSLIDVPIWDYLCDSGTEFEGLKIWGSPWIKSFQGMNPKCKAFTLDTEEELAEKWKLIPNDTDILITHCPPYGTLDNIGSPGKMECVGSKTLLMKVETLSNIKLHMFGHIHESYGIDSPRWDDSDYKRVNASHVNERYDPVNEPIRIILDVNSH